MTKSIVSTAKIATKRIILSGIIALLLTNIAFVYKKPRQRHRSSPTVTGSDATRTGECLRSPQYISNLIVLAPVGHIGQTVSTQPTFAWFLPLTQVTKMEFAIFEYVNNARGKKIKTFEIDSKPGRIMKFSPTPGEFTFEVGKTYLWQITLLCDRNNPSDEVYAEAVIEILPKSPVLVTQLSQSKNSLQRVQIYADAGLWYDALSEVLENPLGQAFQSQLLNQLSKLEAQSVSEVSSEKFKKYLKKQIAGLEKLSQSRQ